MAYTATKYVGVRLYPFPRGAESGTQRSTILRGNLVECTTPTEYTPGGIGSTSFQVTAFSATGLVTYSLLLGSPLVNGQRVVIYNTASNYNDGTYIVSAITPASATTGTFVAVPIGNNVLNGTAQTSQTAEGVGQLNFGNRNLQSQTFTVSAVTWSGGISKLSYTTLTGTQLWPGDQVTISGMTHAGNNGTFTVTAVYPTSGTNATAGIFIINNPNGVATDSGTGTGNFTAGSSDSSVTNESPTQVKIDSSNGWVYRFDYTNQTIRIYTTGTGSGDILNEAALAASVAFDPTITFEAIFPRALA